MLLYLYANLIFVARFISLAILHKKNSFLSVSCSEIGLFSSVGVFVLIDLMLILVLLFLRILSRLILFLNCTIILRGRPECTLAVMSDEFSAMSLITLRLCSLLFLHTSQNHGISLFFTISPVRLSNHS